MSAPPWSLEYARAVVAEWRRQVPVKLEPWEQQRLEEEIAEAIEDVNGDAFELGLARLDEAEPEAHEVVLAAPLGVPGVGAGADRPPDPGQALGQGDVRHAVRPTRWRRERAASGSPAPP